MLVVDDHPSLRNAIRADLEDLGFDVCDEAADAATAVAAAVSCRPDVCLLDVSIPGNGLAAAWEIGERLPETRVVFITADADDETLVAALRAGAVGYLPKDVHAERLANEVRRAASGLLSPIIAVRLLPDVRSSPGAAPVEGSGELTDLQVRLLDLLQDSPSIGELASALQLPDDTVRAEMRAISAGARAKPPAELLIPLGS